MQNHGNQYMMLITIHDSNHEGEILEKDNMKLIFGLYFTCLIELYFNIKI